MWCTYIMKYYSAINKENLPYVTTQMDLEDIMLSEITQRKTSTVLSHLYVGSKTIKLIERESSMVVARSGVVGEMGRCWSKGTNFQLLDE